MTTPRQTMVDLLEVYHARQTHRTLVRELARVRGDGRCAPWMDPAQREEVERCYEQMVLLSRELLGVLDDDPEPGAG